MREQRGEVDCSLLQIPCKGLSLTACAETMALRSLNHAQHVCVPHSLTVCVRVCVSVC